MKPEFTFTPAYYEWHLLDSNGKIVHNMVDPGEDMCHEDGTPLSYDEVLSFVSEDLNAAESNYADGKEYNGIMLEDGFTAPQMKAAAKVMARSLYNYYIA